SKTGTSRSLLEVWSLEFLWMLELEIWSFISALPIHRQRRAVNRPRRIRCQEGDNVRNRLRRDPFAEIRIGHGGAVLWCVNNAWHDAIHVDVRSFQFGRQ